MFHQRSWRRSSRRSETGRSGAAVLTVLVLVAGITFIGCGDEAAKDGAPGRGEAGDRPASQIGLPSPNTGADGLVPIDKLEAMVKGTDDLRLTPEEAARVRFAAIDDGAHIVGYDENGEEVGELARSPYRLFDLVYVPGHDRYYYVRRGSFGLTDRYDVISMARDGGDQRVLTVDHPPVAEVEQAVRNGRGRQKIRYETPMATASLDAIHVFGARSDGEQGLFRLALDGSSLEPVLTFVREDEQSLWFTLPAISPDGERVALVKTAYENDVRGETLVIQDLGSGRETTLRRDTGVSYAQIRFLPSGDRLLYVLRRVDEPDELVLQAAGVSPEEPRVVLTGELIQMNPSPDGQNVVFSEIVGSNANLGVVSLAGGEPKRITSGPGKRRHPVWLSR